MITRPIFFIVFVLVGVSGLLFILIRTPYPREKTTVPVSSSSPSSVSDNSAVIVGAGDIASCENENDEATATLLDSIQGTIFTLGDNAYPNGTPIDFQQCFEPTWGRHKERIFPAAGNHDYNTANAVGYFNYFGAAAGDPNQGYYSYDLGAWHIVVLNSNCQSIIGCHSESVQVRWLKQDLADHPTQCTLAYWHHPRFSSGNVHGSNPVTDTFWRILYAAGADIVVAGHEHNYERFTPMDPEGQPDAEHGLREFIAGTGGQNLYSFGTPLPTSEVRDSNTFGVLKFILLPTSYTWEFIPAAGATFHDEGSANCHGSLSFT